MLRNFIALLLTITLASAVFAQDAATPPEDTRAATGGAPTLADIMARQNGEQVPNATRELLTGDPLNAANVANQLGTLGGASWLATFEIGRHTSELQSPVPISYAVFCLKKKNL